MLAVVALAQQIKQFLSHTQKLWQPEEVVS